MYVKATVLETLDDHALATAYFEKNSGAARFPTEDVRQEPVTG
jgi:hypothetical protein